MPLISATRALTYGGAVLTASDGVKLAVIANTGFSTVYLYSGVDTGSPTAEDTASNTTMFGDSSLVGGLSAAIDDADSVHVLVSSSSISSTRNVAYCIATRSGGSWSFGTWEEAAAYTDGPIRDNDIIIDHNGDPHIVYCDWITSKGASTAQIMYTEKTGASWATPTQISPRADKTDDYINPKIAQASISPIYEVLYKANAGATYTPNVHSILWRDYTIGSWGSESIYTESTQSFVHGLDYFLPYTSFYRAHTVSGNIEINNVAQVSAGQNDRYGAGICRRGRVRFVFRIDSSGYVTYIYAPNSSTWYPGAILDGSGAFNRVIVESSWAVRNFSDTEVSFIYSTVGGNVYYGIAEFPAFGKTNKLRANAVYRM